MTTTIVSSEVLLEDIMYVECPVCGKPAPRSDWETNHSGAINAHWSVNCGHCGFKDGSYDDDSDE